MSFESSFLGWQCPACHINYAPSVTSCDCCISVCVSGTGTAEEAMGVMIPVVTEPMPNTAPGPRPQNTSTATDSITNAGPEGLPVAELFHPSAK